MSDSESVAPGPANSFGSIPAAALAVGSPPGSYHIGMQASRQQSDANGPSDTLPSYLKSSSQLNGDLYTQGSQSNSAIPTPLYNSLAHPPLDFSNLNSAEHDALNKQSTLNGFSLSGPFRQSFNPFPNSRPRNGTNSFRDPSTTFAATYQTVPENIFVPNTPSSGMSFEPVHHPGRYELGFGGSASLGQSKSTQFTPGDAYRLGLESSIAPAASQIKPSTSVSALRDAQVSQLPGAQQGFAVPHMNGLSHSHQHHNQAQVQNAFGSLPNTNAPVPSAPGAIQHTTSASSASGAGHVNGVGLPQQGSQNQQNGQQPQEEISTIFVVGFPDDMSEREFQNMFTFSTGFEAATLKIPNKDLTAYGGTGGVIAPGLGARATSLGGHYGGSTDPYNIVNINQGGVVVDGRDGTTSWPAAVPVAEDMHFPTAALPMQPPRKQIIGFAKFRTRKEALEARDVLQGRRVDIEKGAVLKAEMAKKNLHTKRGPGVGPLGIAAALSGGAADLSGVTSLGGLTNIGASRDGAGEAFSQRERELGALGAMGVAGLGRRLGEEEARQNGIINLSSFGPRGARERAEEDEREREKKRKEKEAQRLRQNSFAFEAFHSVPQQMARQGTNSLLSAEGGTIGTSLNGPSSFGQPLAPQGEHGVSSGPWGVLRDVSAKNPVAPVPISVTTSQRSSTPSADQGASPTTRDPFIASHDVDGNVATSPKASHDHRTTSPSSETASLTVGSGTNRSLPTSSASSVNGSVPVGEEELTKAVGALAVSTTNGSTSPQLPSPSSGSGRPGDQNPPINTLYVGNLPTSTSPGSSPPATLEERLRDLFKAQPGYSKLVFRQKSNGLMCFVEFEDVSYATRAINELYGDTLGGLIKNGGIRLSYSKNPLGVRTPTNGTNGGLQYQPPNSAHQQGFSGMQVLTGDGENTRVNTNAFNHTRRDTNSTSGMTSPTNSYFYTMSSPPPRFLNSPPGGVPFSTTIGTPSAGFPRAHAPFGITSSLSSGAGQTTTFSPFGLSSAMSQSHQPYNQLNHHPQLPSQVPQTHSTIPDQSSSDASKHLHHDLSHLTPSNIEASRAG